MKMKRAVGMGLKPSVFAVASATPYAGQQKSQQPDGEPTKPGRNTAPVSLGGTANRGGGKAPGFANGGRVKPDPEESGEPKLSPKAERKEEAAEKKAKK